MIKIMIRRS